MKVIVIGDIMIDINYFSKIERCAPESADVHIHDIYETSYILGGASNVAQNLCNLYQRRFETAPPRGAIAQTVTGNLVEVSSAERIEIFNGVNVDVELISVIGNDNCGKKIQSLLEEKNIKHKLFVDTSRKTTQKNRIFNNNKLSVRYDIEERTPINHELQNNIFEYIKTKNNVAAIVISDYDKGVLHFDLTKAIIDYANLNSILTFVDPKVNNYLKYQNCFCFKPNLMESEIISGKKDITEIIIFLQENIKSNHLIITCGKDGIIVDNIDTIIKHPDEINVVDVTGSGDIVLSVLVYVYLFICKDIVIASKIANYIAGMGVSVIGNYVINMNDINNYLHANNIICKGNKNNNNNNNKVIYDFEYNKILTIKSLHKHNKITFTNGCFDILHSAHIKLLQFAKSCGDILVVGLNSDESIKRLKGESRPINLIDERSIILSLFDFIDYIIVFNDDTPLNIIKTLEPNIIIKGSDYSKENVVGKEYVDEIVLFDFIDNKSSSLVINKIQNQNQK
jgi:D-beta-D-heptose 7-phosphate kinase/D-beta-D-heptose 1-phosphate adenosyltransferase